MYPDFTFEPEFQEEPVETVVGEDPFSLYLQDIHRYSILTPEAEVDLARLAREGNRAAQNRLVEANLRFVILVAKHFRGCGITMSDLVEEGNLGIIEAAKRFDPERGVRFVSYAVFWIRQSILRAIAEQGNFTKLPQRQAQLASRMRKATKYLTQQEDSPPSAREVAEELGEDLGQVENLWNIIGPKVNLDEASYDEEGFAMSSSLPDTDLTPADEMYMEEELHREVMALLQTLTPRERDILTRRYGMEDRPEETLKTIGEAHHITRERARQIEINAREKLRAVAQRGGLEDYLR